MAPSDGMVCLRQHADLSCIFNSWTPNYCWKATEDHHSILEKFLEEMQQEMEAHEESLVLRVPLLLTWLSSKMGDTPKIVVKSAGK